MNILLTNSSNLYAGGEFYVLELARTLTARRHTVWVACRPDNLLREKCERAGVQTVPVDFPSNGKLLAYIRKLQQFIIEHNIGIVHTNSNYDRTAGAFAAHLANVPHVTNVHSFHSLQHNLTHWLRNRKATDHFIVDGTSIERLLIKDDRIPLEKISVVYLGVDPEQMKNSPERREAIRREFGFAGEHIVIGNVARLVPFKGHEYLLRAFAGISGAFPPARLLLVGDGELRNELEALARSLNISDAVRFAGFRDDLVSLYSGFDIYTHPSVEGGGETFPFAVLQALAQELPVVVTKVGDVAAMVRIDDNGYVIPDRDETALAGRLRELLSSQELRRTMGQRSRKLLIEQFTLEKMTDAIESVYDRVLQK